MLIAACRGQIAVKPRNWKTDSYLIFVTKQYPYTEFTLPFAPGDVLLLMSDGLPERFNADREMLGDESIKQKLADLAPTTLPQTLIQHLLNLGENWANGIPQDDDITLLILKARA